jgi:DNA-binding response OmpR family regulator
VRIARLRRRIEADPARPRTIRTVRGLGYVFEPAGEEAAQ